MHLVEAPALFHRRTLVFESASKVVCEANVSPERESNTAGAKNGSEGPKKKGNF